MTPRLAMTPTDLRTLRVDLKGAARLGLPEALDWALEGLQTWPEVAANQPLTPKTIDQLLSLGKILAGPRVPAAYLHGLSKHGLAAYRTLAAGAWATRLGRGDAAAQAPLTRLAGDPRPDVRAAVEKALAEADALPPDRLASLIQRWLRSGPGVSPRAQEVALRLLPALGQKRPALALALLREAAFPTALEPAVGEALSALAAAGQSEAVLTLLEAWARSAEPHLTAIVRALRGSWARRHRPRALAILDVLEARHPASRALRRARQFLTS